MTAATPGLIDFLRARLDERQRVAEDAAAAVRRWPKNNPPPWDRARLMVAKMRDEFGGHARRAVALDAFEGRESPADVLADVASKRALIEEIEGLESQIDGEWGNGTGFTDSQTALRFLAAPFAGHPDFDPAWAVPGEAS